MTPATLHFHLDSYLSLREALGFQMRVERTLLRDFVQFLKPLTSLALFGLNWLSIGPVAPRPHAVPVAPPSALSMARGFLTYLRATLPETEVPERHVIAAARRPKPFLSSYRTSCTR